MVSAQALRLLLEAWDRADARDTTKDELAPGLPAAHHRSSFSPGPVLESVQIYREAVSFIEALRSSFLFNGFHKQQRVNH